MRTCSGSDSRRASTCPHELPGLFQDPEWKMRTQQARWFPAETVSVAIGQAMAVTAGAARAGGGGGGQRREAGHTAHREGGRVARPWTTRRRGTSASVPRWWPPSVTRWSASSARARASGRSWKASWWAGKTGSAQVVTHARLESEQADARVPAAWVVHQLRARRPSTDRDGGDGGARRRGGTSAAPVAGQILSRYFGVRPIGPGMNLPPDNPPVEPSPQPLRAQTAPPSPALARAQPD